MRKSFVTAIKTVAVAFLLIVLLFANAVWGSSLGFSVTALREVTAVFRNTETQWMVFLCLAIYFTVFLFFRSRAVSDFWRAANPNLWLALGLFISAIFYGVNYSPSLDALTLLGGAVLGQGVAVWAGFNADKPFPHSAFRFPVLLVSLLMILLALASVWNVATGRSYEYRSHVRWSGPWENPNIAGLLMGVGVVLAAGGAVLCVMCRGSKKDEVRSWKLGVGKYVVVILFLFVAGLMARGSLHSYSRGAWLATGCGVTYLWSTVRSPRSMVSARSCGSCISWFNKNWLSLSAILISVVILSFWHFRQTEWHPAHRAFSVSNQNDFSWRNRLSAWEAALQITAEHPGFGAGWNQPKLMYEHYYLSPKVTESAAIEMNDYLMLGATLGIPALFCFGMYVWLSLMRNAECGVRNLEGGNQNMETGWKHCPTLELDWLPATCRAGAIVLLVGFWFDGGLFKLATASIFWILLELGCADLVQQKATGEKKGNPILA